MASVTTTTSELAGPGSARTSTARFYHPELDELRFFAFLMVFLHHALPHDPTFWTNLGSPVFLARVVAGVGATGAFGVSLFFVLSSYLITELLLREKQLIGTLDIRSFYIRRILRIWPLYFAFLALAVALQWIVPGQHVTLRAGVWFSFLAGNWFIVFHGFPSSVIFPLWSVSIEEQFYITWPAVVRKVSETGMLLFAGGLLAAATVARIYLGMDHALEGDVWCNTFVQLDPIAAGILIAVLLKGEIPRLSRLARVAMMLAGITALAFGSLYFGIKNDPLTTARIVLGYPSVAIGGALLLLSVLRSRTSGGNRALIYLGRISYGLYVFHVLGLLISDHTVPDQTASLFRYSLRVGVALAATIAMAAVSYRWLETPFLSLKQRFTHVLSRPGG
ncbi:MAG TPA: acyltransferase [Candidatus Limnocylindrales bacterium]|nr:acyltransferase [Candidatus Limnocylindrales bacterium]